MQYNYRTWEEWLQAFNWTIPNRMDTIKTIMTTSSRVLYILCTADSKYDALEMFKMIENKW